jgi:hypothetical protein
MRRTLQEGSSEKKEEEEKNSLNASSEIFFTMFIYLPKAS